MQIDFYVNFYKKNNSTLRPVEGPTTPKHSLQGYLKEPCSIMNPVINIQNIPMQSAPCVMTYAYIAVFSRYYFVKDWVWNDGLWTVSLDVDVLATYRDEIGNQTEYILRTDSSNNPLNFDGAISDGMYPATTNFSIDRVALQNPFVNQIGYGVYVLGIISNESSNAVGAITYYAMTPSQFGNFKAYLLSPACFEDMDLVEIVDNVLTWKVSDMSEEIFKTMYNPYQYIASCMWFPVSPSSITGTSVNKISVGWWEFGISGKRMSSYTGAFNDGVERIPPHPDAATRGKYLNYAPYTKLSLHGKFGSLPLDTMYFEVGDYIVNTYTVDYITGQCLFEVFTADNASGLYRKLITKTEFLIGVPIQIAQIGRDYLGLAVNAMNAGSSAATGFIAGGAVGGIGGGIIGAISSAGSAILNAADSFMPQLQTSGVNGSFIGNALSTVLIVYHSVIVDEDITHRGRPLCQNRQIKTLSGYILCAEGDLDLNAFDAERQEIARFLTTGFFWE